MSLGKLIFESSTPRVSLVGWLCCCDTGTDTGTGMKAGKFNQDFGRRKSRMDKLRFWVAKDVRQGSIGF